MTNHRDVYDDVRQLARVRDEQVAYLAGTEGCDALLDEITNNALPGPVAPHGSGGYACP